MIQNLKGKARKSIRKNQIEKLRNLTIQFD